MVGGANLVTDGRVRVRGVGRRGGGFGRLSGDWTVWRVGAVTTNGDDPAGDGGRSDGGLGEGHSEVLVVVQLVVVQGDQRLDGLLHRRQLHQRHLPVLPAGGENEIHLSLLREVGGGPGWLNGLW